MNDHFNKSSLNCFAAPAIDRMSSLRRDNKWVNEQLSKKTTRFVPVWRSMNLFKNQNGFQPVFSSSKDFNGLIPKDTPPILLGNLNHITYFAADLPSKETQVPEKLASLGRFEDLRKAGAILDGKDSVLLAYARAMTYWQHRNRFCGDCGEPNISEEAGHMLVCSNPKCGQKHFPRTDPAIIVLVTSGDQCLLGRQPVWPPKWYSTIAGFVDPGESLENAVVREVFEETGVEVKNIFYYSSQPWPFPSSIMLGFTARAENKKIDIDGDEIEHADWFSREDIYKKVKQKQLRLPPPVSIAYRLIEHWFDKGAFGKLEELYRKNTKV